MQSPQIRACWPEPTRALRPRPPSPRVTLNATGSRAVIRLGCRSVRSPHPVVDHRRSPPPRRIQYHDRGHSAADQGRWALCPGGDRWWDENMMSDSTLKPAGGGHPRIEPPASGPLPIQHDATAAAPRQGQHGQHDSPAPRRSERNTPHRSVILIRARRLSRGRPSQAEPDRRQPADQPGPECDLCDDIVQQLFATGIAMRTTQRRCRDHPEVAARIAEHMNDLQRIIDQLRSTTPVPRALPPQSHVS